MNVRPADDFSFGVGDIVRLTGGSDKMTVHALPDDESEDGDTRISVIWHDDAGGLQEAAIDPAALVLVKRGVDARLR
jgi:uncharacterized protein YodC (DUF2158 family)